MSEQERRQYIRVEDTIGIVCHVIKNNKANGQELSELKAKFRFGKSRDLQEIDNQLKMLSIQMRGKNRLASEAISLLDKKITLLAGNILRAVAEHDDVAEQEVPVNISASGLGFETGDVFHSGEKVWMEITLSPSMTRLGLVANVVAYTAFEDGGLGVVHVEYENLRDEDYESLVQHVIQRESYLLRRRRQSQDSER